MRIQYVGYVTNDRRDIMGHHGVTCCYKMYKWCAVPQCTNTSIKTPEKLFLTIPKNADVRKKWLELAHRNPKDLAASTNAFFCEDHFNLEMDVANYTQYKMGYSQHKLLVEGALPSKFHCQTDRRRKLSDPSISRTAYLKRLKTNRIRENEEEAQAALNEPDTRTPNNDQVNMPENVTDTVATESSLMANEQDENKIFIKQEKETSPDTEIKNQIPTMTNQIYIKTEVDDDEKMFVTEQENIKVEPNWDEENFDTDPLKLDGYHENRAIVKFEKEVVPEMEIGVPQNSLETNQPRNNTEIEVDEEISEAQSNEETELSYLFPISAITEKLPKYPHVCHICSRSFKKKSNLTLHIPIHTDEKPYVCNICDKSFAVARYLSKHKLIHTEEKAHVCDVCNKSFTTLSYLVQHKLVHSAEKPYVCNICNKSFNYMRYLSEHKLQHTGERPHVCNICNKTYTTFRSLNRHKTSHTEENRQVCNKSDEPFNKQVP